ncbi:hypothetical protein Q1695_005870 [Nippostrongylus brasiliensis]|nr:hypothetical protein Q1695_005870 [Nippostrongylus brasiliensis]
MTDYEAVYRNFTGDFNELIVIEDYYLADIYVYLPYHSLTLIYILIVLISLVRNRHLQPRPKQMFLFSCTFFTLAAVYNFATDVSYLVMLRKQMTIQQCSVIRNFVQNPIAAQGLVDAIDRYIILFDIGMLHPMILILYITFPAVNVAFSAYNSFLTSDWVKDDVVCLITRRNSLTSNLLFASQWVATLVAILLYFRIYRKIIRHVERQRNSNPGSLSQQNYYRDRSVVSLFFVCATIPIILVCPTIVVTLVSAIFGVHNKVVTLLCWLYLDSTIPFIWTVYILYIPSIRQGVLDLVGIKPKAASNEGSRTGVSSRN